MRIEQLSIRAVTVAIFTMVGVVAIVLSLFAGAYFRQAALNAQVVSLSRVIEVAAGEVLRELAGHAFDLGMKLGHNRELIEAVRVAAGGAATAPLVTLLDDPFTSGFVGFAEINLVKLRVYNLELELVAQSAAGIDGLDDHLPDHLAAQVARRTGTERLKALDALWPSAQGPLHSTLLPLGGLRALGYLEVVVDPAFNLPEIGTLTGTPVSVFSMAGDRLNGGPGETAGRLPVAFILPASTGEPAFRIVGYEDIGALRQAMEHTQQVTTAGFLLLTLGTLLFALWLFNRFLFVPLGRMVEGMEQIAHGRLELAVDKRGLREFSTLAGSFELMANQVKQRSRDLERLLDLDDSAIICFGQDGEAVYLNRSAEALFGYGAEEIGDLDLDDLFTGDGVRLLRQAPRANADGVEANTVHLRLDCRRRDGQVLPCDAAINPLGLAGGVGCALVLNPVAAAPDEGLTRIVVNTIEQNEQRMRAVEHSLNSILEIARNSPGLLPGMAALDGEAPSGPTTADARHRLREQVVHVMQSALACWERDLDRSKLELAEASGIWPVYIDKSTPTTRTLDKYLHLDSCPRHPRSQRVIDTAEFVLRQLNRKTTLGRRQLQQALDDLRRQLAGLDGTG